MDFSRAHYETDRVTYHVSGTLDEVPSSADLSDEELPYLFDQFDTRQVLHVTFGSVLSTYGVQLDQLLRLNPELYTQFLKSHFKRHLDPFAK